MPRTPTEQIVELQRGFDVVQARLNTVDRTVTDGAAELKLVVAELAAIRQDFAVLRQRLDDHLKRVELWDTRRWGLVVAVGLAALGAALSFASGLLLTTLRTPTK